MIGLLAAAGAAALTPSGPWAIDAGPHACMLTREFGDGSGKVAIGLRPIPLTDGAELLVFRTVSRREWVIGRGQLRIGNNPPIKVLFDSAGAPKSYDRITSMYIDRAAVTGLAEGTTLTFDLRDEWRGTVAPTAIGAGLKALADCERRQYAEWGVAERELTAAVKKPELLDPRNTFRHEDFPAAEKSAGYIGRTVALVAVDAAGAIGDCRTVISAGTDVLDATVCRLARERARYRPATDSTGKPIAAHAVIKIYWGSWNAPEPR